ncbi:MAG TPA: hypothetical protein VHE81_03380, partial [Lacipirellulaceae bacterium]|nr:hypothetical protein [Lacipirellulaceae bacterium]
MIMRTHWADRPTRAAIPLLARPPADNKMVLARRLFTVFFNCRFIRWSFRLSGGATRRTLTLLIL